MALLQPLIDSSEVATTSRTRSARSAGKSGWESRRSASRCRTIDWKNEEIEAPPKGADGATGAATPAAAPVPAPPKIPFRKGLKAAAYGLAAAKGFPARGFPTVAPGPLRVNYDNSVT